MARKAPHAHTLNTSTKRALREFGLIPETHGLLWAVATWPKPVYTSQFPDHWTPIVGDFTAHGYIERKGDELSLTATGRTLLNAISDLLNGKDANARSKPTVKKSVLTGRNNS